MPLNGAGSYTPPAPDFPAISGTLIEAAKFNAIITDIASALSLALYRDGQVPFSANQSMGNFRLTNVGAPVGSQDAINLTYLVNYVTSQIALGSVYLGSFTANPTERPDGTALQPGDIYLNISNPLMPYFRAFSGTVWVEGIPGDAATINYTPAGTGAVATTVEAKLRQIGVTATDKGAVAGATDSTAAIQGILDDLFAAGGGTLLIPKAADSFKVSDTLTVRDNTRIVFENWIELTQASSTGTVFYLEGDNIEIINPLVNGGGAASNAGENGIGIVSGTNIKVWGGQVINCNRGGAGNAFGGKGVQIEDGDVGSVLVLGTRFKDCFMAMSTVRDGGDVNPSFGIHFNSVTAEDCEILLFVKQANINNTNGLEHTVQLTNFTAKNCGSFEGVMQFSRAANVLVADGTVVNDPAVVTTPLIRGNHRFCNFDNIRFSGNCDRIIDLDPSTFAVDSSNLCENNTYDIKHSGIAGYVAFSSPTTTNRILQDCVIKACLDSDVTNKIVGDELRNGYCRLEVQQGNKTIISTTSTLFLEGRTNFASFPTGISMMRFNGSQIAFPAAQILSTDPNTLDDYQEGTWTPTDNSGDGLVFSLAYGDYIKVGRLVTASFAVTYPATASGTVASIGGLPFLTQNIGGRVTGGLALGYTDQGAFVSATANAGATAFSLANLAGGLVTNAGMSGKILRAVFTYIANE